MTAAIWPRGEHMAFSVTDIQTVGEILAFAARTEIMPRFGRLAPGQIRRKSSVFDLVTEADEAAEGVIEKSLIAAFPGAVVIGEESAHKAPAILDTIADAQLAFIVDPVDGTRNFASDLPLFGVMAAVTVRGEIVASVIHDPVCRDWAYAVRDGGAWIEEEDGARRSLLVADPGPVAGM